MDFSWQLLKTIFYLIIIILLFYILVKFIKKQTKLQGFNQNLKVLERLHFNSNQALYLIQITDEVWVLGVSEERVQLLDKIEETEKTKKLLNDKSNHNKFDWKSGLKKYFNKDGQNNEEE